MSVEMLRKSLRVSILEGDTCTYDPVYFSFTNSLLRREDGKLKVPVMTSFLEEEGGLRVWN